MNVIEGGCDDERGYGDGRRDWNWRMNVVGGDCDDRRGC